MGFWCMKADVYQLEQLRHTLDGIQDEKHFYRAINKATRNLASQTIRRALRTATPRGNPRTRPAGKRSLRRSIRVVRKSYPRALRTKLAYYTVGWTHRYNYWIPLTFKGQHAGFVQSTYGNMVRRYGDMLRREIPKAVVQTLRRNIRR